MYSDDVVELNRSFVQPSKFKGKTKEKGKKLIGSYFMPITTPGAQPTIKSVAK